MQASELAGVTVVDSDHLGVPVQRVRPSAREAGQQQPTTGAAIPRASDPDAALRERLEAGQWESFVMSDGTRIRIGAVIGNYAFNTMEEARQADEATRLMMSFRENPPEHASDVNMLLENIRSDFAIKFRQEVAFQIVRDATDHSVRIVR